MQQPQSRPLIGDSGSSSTTPNTRRNGNNPVAVLTQQQFQQIQQLQSQNSGQQSVTFTLQQPSNTPQDATNVTTTGNHILYLNQLSQLNQGTINSSGTGMGLSTTTPTFGVGLNMGLPLSLLNTNLNSLASNAITTSNQLVNLSIPNINSGLTAINPSINQLSSLGTNLNSNLTPDPISNGLSNISQDLAGISRLGTLNPTSISSGISNISTGLTNVNTNLNNLNNSTLSPNLASINASLSSNNSAANSLNTLNSNISLSNNLNSTLNQQGLNRSLATIGNLNPTSSTTQFPFQTIQSIQSIAPHIVGANLTNVTSSITQNQSSIANSTAQVTGSSINSSSTFTNTLASTSNVTHGSNANQQLNTAQFGIVNSTIHSISATQLKTNESTPSISNFCQFSTQPLSHTSNQNTSSIIPNIKTMQNIQSQAATSPSSPFSMPLKSPSSSNITPPTPSPSPNSRVVLRSPAPNSIQARNSPSPVASSTGNFNIQLQQSPMQSPVSVGQIQSPIPSPYAPAKSPHLLGAGSSLNNKSPVPGGSPGPPVVRPNTPILQPGMQVLQIIQGPQGYQQATQQLVTRAQLFGNQQIQITNKPNKQPPQILPKPPIQQNNVVNQQKPRVSTSINNQVQQQSQSQIIFTSPPQNQQTQNMMQPQVVLNQVLPSTGHQVLGLQSGLQLLLRPNTQQQTHPTQLPAQPILRVVTAPNMQLQGLGPTFFAVPNGFSSPATPVIRQTPTSSAPSNTSNNNSIVLQNAVVQNSQNQISQSNPINAAANVQSSQTILNQNLLPPPKKKTKKKKKSKKKEDELPKLDLASIMKISGIGDDDDLFDGDFGPEAEKPSLVENNVQNNSFVTVPTSTTQSVTQTLSQQNIAPQKVLQQNVVQPSILQQNVVPQNVVQQNIHQNVIQQNISQQTPTTNLPSNQTLCIQDNSSQLSGQLQSPISGQLRLAIGEDGQLVLHHTPDSNHPEIDQATAQALIKSLTQGGGQNAQIITQLIAQVHAVQNAQNKNNVINNNKLTIVKPSVTNNLRTTPITNTSNQQVTKQIICQQLQVNTSSSNSQNFNSSNTLQNSNQNVVQTQKNIVVSRKVFDTKKQVVAKTSICQRVGNQIVNQITHNQQQTANAQQVKCNQIKGKNAIINVSQPQNIRTNISQIQKPMQICGPTQQNIQVLKNHQSQTNQVNVQEDGKFSLLQNQVILNPNATQNLNSHQRQAQTFQQIFDSLQSNVSRQNADGIKIETANVLQNSTNNVQQSQPQTLNFIQQNAENNTSTNDHSLQLGSDVQLTQQQTIQTNSNIQRQQNTKPNNMLGSNITFDQRQNVPTNILISNSSVPIEQSQQLKLETKNLCNLSTSAVSIFNGAPKFTTEILNALKHLNPNDQLLIATANGQMQVISQQILQQFLSAQIQAQNQALNQQQQQQQNSTSNLAIKDVDANNPNTPEVQINTPTGQIIVNTSQAPTIQNNIRNIVVQTSSSQIPQSIQIQNSSFPNQFLDQLNQQQRNNINVSSGNSVNPTSHNTVTNQAISQKKVKATKKAKIMVQQTMKIINATKPVTTVTVSSTETVIMTQASPIQTAHSSLTVSNPIISRLNHQTDKSPTFVVHATGEIKTEQTQCMNFNGHISQISAASNQMIPTLHLTPQKQQLLAVTQAQIRGMLQKQSHSPSEQVVLSKLCQEQARILSGGKVINKSTLPLIPESTKTLNINVTSSNASDPTNVPCITSTKQSLTIVQTQTTNSCQTSTLPADSVSYQSNAPTSNLYMQSTDVSSPKSSSIQQKQQQQQQQISFNPSTAKQLAQPIQIENLQSLSLPSINYTASSNSAITIEVPNIPVTQCEPEDVKPLLNESKMLTCCPRLPTPAAATQPRAGPSLAGQVTPPNLNQAAVSIQNQSTISERMVVSPKRAIKRSYSASPERILDNRRELFTKQIKLDQDAALNPDIKTPFKDEEDACSRLLKYHCFYEPEFNKNDKVEDVFEESAKHLLNKYNSMIGKYNYLLMVDSTRETRPAELTMIERMLLNEERDLSIAEKEKAAAEKLAEEARKQEERLELEAGLFDDLNNSIGDNHLRDVLDSNDASIRSNEYDEWDEIQKEVAQQQKQMDTYQADRDLVNGEVLNVANELEHGLLEDSESLDELSLFAQAGQLRNELPQLHQLQQHAQLQQHQLQHSQLQQPQAQLQLQQIQQQMQHQPLLQQQQHRPPQQLQTPIQRFSAPVEPDAIHAQVQSAIESILSLKKRSASAPQDQPETGDIIHDQTVQYSSILGS
ncbi:hypothetical protein TKK_0016573 [Trichogramma kaykai]|uniref:GLTSCR protein conserved domain-containing protein n=1 Tax=Trichogramma kaykai TaxID=54128 RepID=A0ABD2W6Q1_9HYME